MRKRGRDLKGREKRIVNKAEVYYGKVGLRQSLVNITVVRPRLLRASKGTRNQVKRLGDSKTPIMDKRRQPVREVKRNDNFGRLQGVRLFCFHPIMNSDKRRTKYSEDIIISKIVRLLDCIHKRSDFPQDTLNLIV